MRNTLLYLLLISCLYSCGANQENEDKRREFLLAAAEAYGESNKFIYYKAPIVYDRYKDSLFTKEACEAPDYVYFRDRPILKLNYGEESARLFEELFFIKEETEIPKISFLDEESDMQFYSNSPISAAFWASEERESEACIIDLSFHNRSQKIDSLQIRNTIAINYPCEGRIIQLEINACKVKYRRYLRDSSYVFTKEEADLANLYLAKQSIDLRKYLTFIAISRLNNWSDEFVRSGPLAQELFGTSFEVLTNDFSIGKCLFAPRPLKKKPYLYNVLEINVPIPLSKTFTLIMYIRIKDYILQSSAEKNKG